MTDAAPGPPVRLCDGCGWRGDPNLTPPPEGDPCPVCGDGTMRRYVRADRRPDRDPRDEPGGPHGPELRDPEGERDGLGGRVDGEVSTWRGRRVGRRRADY